MQDKHGAHMEAHAAHQHHWEWSWAPMAISFGAMFLVPVAFICKFVYGAPLLAIVAAGLGAPLVVAGVARWIHEGVTQHAVITKVSPIGIGVFIIGEVLIFLGLFASYWAMRLSAGVDWPPPGTPHFDKVLPLIMTAILVASSLTYHHAEAEFEQGRQGSFMTWVVISIVLGAVFLGCTAYEYSHLFHEKFLPGTNAFSAAFYSLTGFHGSHVLVGLLSFVALIVGVMRYGTVNHMFVKVAGIYWHFVDVVWFFVASQVYYW